MDGDRENVAAPANLKEGIQPPGRSMAMSALQLPTIRGPAVTGSYRQLPAVTGSYRQLPAVIGSYRQLPAVTGSYRQLPAVTD